MRQILRSDRKTIAGRTEEETSGSKWPAGCRESHLCRVTAKSSGWLAGVERSRSQVGEERGQGLATAGFGECVRQFESRPSVPFDRCDHSF